MVLRLPDSWPNCNLAMLVFEERGKAEYPEKNLSEQGRELTTNSTHIWRRRRELNPGHIGERRVLSPLRHPCSPEQYSTLFATSKQVFNFWVKLRKKICLPLQKTKKKKRFWFMERYPGPLATRTGLYHFFSNSNSSIIQGIQPLF